MRHVSLNVFDSTVELVTTASHLLSDADKQLTAAFFSLAYSVLPYEQHKRNNHYWLALNRHYGKPNDSKRGDS